MNNWQSLQVLSLRESQQYIEKIYKLKCHWISRAKKSPFFTLGMVGYLDGPDGSYFDLNKRILNNKILSDNFTDLHNKVIMALFYLFKIPCEVYNNGAIPGFHIYLPHNTLKSACSVHSNTAHMDTQFKYCFPEKGFKEDDFISFTLTLSCSPKSGLNIWKPDVKLPENILDLIDEKSHIGLSGKDPISKYALQTIYQQPKFIQYNIGSLFVHHGIFFHHPILEAEKIPRITLQGHGIKKDGKFLLFW